MPKPHIAILDQGEPSKLIADLTGLALIKQPTGADYILCYQHSQTKGIPPAHVDIIDAEHHLQLRPTRPHQACIEVDFLQGKLGFRRQPGRFDHEPLARAVGLTKIHKPSLIDVTAGWGTDGFLLASLGCEVRLIERDPLVNCLLADGIRRLQLHEALSLSLAVGDALHLLPLMAAEQSVDVIYLDPMFPCRQKSAAVKKNMAFLHTWLASISDDANAKLLDLSLHLAKKRVVVKRPNTASPLSARAPNGSIHTKHHRFDIYAPSLLS